jgi:hypothetical protein
LPLLSGCGGAEPECDSLETRDSVVKIVSGDGHNALVNCAAKNSSVVEARVSKASTEAERLAIWETARQGASCGLVAIGTNSKSRRAVTCSGLLSPTVEDVTAQKQVDFKVEHQTEMYPFRSVRFDFDSLYVYGAFWRQRCRNVSSRVWALTAYSGSLGAAKATLLSPHPTNEDHSCQGRFAMA